MRGRFFDPRPRYQVANKRLGKESKPGSRPKIDKLMHDHFLPRDHATEDEGGRGSRLQVELGCRTVPPVRCETRGLGHSPQWIIRACSSAHLTNASADEKPECDGGKRDEDNDFDWGHIHADTLPSSRGFGPRRSNLKVIPCFFARLATYFGRAMSAHAASR